MIYTAILSNKLAVEVPAAVSPAVIRAGLPASSVPEFLVALSAGTPAAFANVPGLNATIEAVGVRASQIGHTHAYRYVWLSSIAFSSIALILSILSPNVDDKMSGKISALVHKRGEDKVSATV